MILSLFFIIENEGNTMTQPNNKMPPMDANTIEKRRIELLNRLAIEVHPLAIFQELDVDKSAAFTLSNGAEKSIRQGLSRRQRRINESSALITVKVAALTPDKTKTVYEVKEFLFENIGTSDAVLVERERLKAGEIEAHTHVYTTPDYLGKTDVGDLIAAVEGPAWVYPTTNMMNPALRIFGILSIYPDRSAELQFYSHDLRDLLHMSNNYGLKKFGLPVHIKSAY